MITYNRAVIDEDYRCAREMFIAYSKWLNINLEFQHFEEELGGLRTMYAAPVGGIILVKDGEVTIGCVAIRKLNDTVGELKRMYILPAYRQQGIGRRLLELALLLATECHYRVIKLDTLNYMLPAIGLYKKAGFYETPPYYHNPNATAIYLEKKL